MVAAVARQLAEALALRPQHDGHGGRAVHGGNVLRCLAVEAQDAEAIVLQFRHGAGEVGDLDEGNMLIGARSRLEEHGRGLRAVAGGGDKGCHVEGRAGADDGAHIVRVRHLVQQHDDAGFLDLVEARLGEGLGLDEQALVHGIRTQAPVQHVGVHDFRRDAARRDFGRQPVGGVFRGLQGIDLALGVLQRLGHGVDAVDDVIGLAHGPPYSASRGACGGKFGGGRRARIIVFRVIAGGRQPV